MPTVQNDERLTIFYGFGNPFPKRTINSKTYTKYFTNILTKGGESLRSRLCNLLKVRGIRNRAATVSERSPQSMCRIPNPFKHTQIIS